MTTTVIDDTVKDILTSRVYDVAVESPLDPAPKLSSLARCKVYLKREDLQPVHSFKLRGAYNKIVQLSSAEKAKGVIAASAGNHAQGVALAAKKLSISALIVMPVTTPSIKVEAVKNFGADIELFGDSYSDAAEYCKTRAKETGRVYVHPFDDPLVIAGQGTIGREILEQLIDCTHIFVPVGGGGLLAGIASYIKTLRPDIKVISVEPEDSNAMQQSIKLKKRVNLSHVGIFADGVAVKQVGQNTFETAMHKVDDFITVTTDQICAAIKNVFEDTRSIVEPAGALAAAGILEYDLPKTARAVAICSGANMTFERLQQVAERTLIGSGKEAMFAVTIPEETGSLKNFCEKVIDGHNISEFNYRYNGAKTAHILVGVNVNGESDIQKFKAKMKKHKYEHIDLSNDDITKEHIRHMIGGSTKPKIKEHIYETKFPDRPRATIDFLKTVGDSCNVSLFHFRNTAGDITTVLIGFQVEKPQELEKRLALAGYEFTKVSDNPAIRIFTK